MPRTFMDLVSEAKTRIKEIDVAGAASVIGTDGVAIVDVREPDEYRQGHIEGAVNIPRGVAEMGIPQVIPHRATRIICYCAGGNRSALVADNLKQMGYDGIESMIGGFAAWARSGNKIAR